MIWKGTKIELMTFIKELNEKHKTIKFQISPRKIAFLGAMFYKTKITTSKQLHIKNLQINKSSQVLGLKTICSTTIEFNNNCAIIKQKFLHRQYKKEVLDEQIKKVDRTERKELFTSKEKSKKKIRIPL